MKPSDEILGTHRVARPSRAELTVEVDLVSTDRPHTPLERGAPSLG
jgi:hypothetical protein